MLIYISTRITLYFSSFFFDIMAALYLHLSAYQLNHLYCTSTECLQKSVKCLDNFKSHHNKRDPEKERAPVGMSAEASSVG